MRGRRATKKMSRSGLTPLRTFRHVTPVEPIHGVTSSTSKQNTAHDPTTTANRAAERPSLGRWNNVAASAIRPFRDSSGDFKDVMQIVRRQHLVGRPFRH